MRLDFDLVSREALARTHTGLLRPRVWSKTPHRQQPPSKQLVFTAADSGFLMPRIFLSCVELWVLDGGQKAQDVANKR